MMYFNVFLVNCDNFGLSVIKVLIWMLKFGKVVGIFLSGIRKMINFYLKCGVVIIVYKVKVLMLFVVYDGLKIFGEILKCKKIIICFGDLVLFNDIEFD